MRMRDEVADEDLETEEGEEEDANSGLKAVEVRATARGIS